MPKFKSIEELKQYLQIQVDNCLNNEVAEAVKAEESEDVYGMVYAAGSPKVYGRREASGGLADVNNMIHTVANGTLIVTNNTPFNPDYDTSNSGSGLDTLIEYGDGGGGHHYDYGSGWWSNPRPFTQTTIDNLEYNKNHINMLWAALRRRGIHVE